MGLTGDFAGLRRLVAQMREVASSRTMQGLSRTMSAEALAQLHLGFRAGRDPYGSAWESLKLRSGGKPLLDTGRLRNSFSARTEAAGFRIGTNFVGAAVHQYGATIQPRRGKFLRFRGKVHGRTRRTTGWIFARQVTIPARPMVPERDGNAWERPLEQAAERFFSRLLKR